jgi:hypothetical protein
MDTLAMAEKLTVFLGFRGAILEEVADGEAVVVLVILGTQ